MNSDIETLKHLLNQAIQVCEENIDKAQNIDLHSLIEVLEDYLSELDIIDDFESYDDLLEDQDYKLNQCIFNQLKEIKVMGKTWYELSLKIGLLAAVNEYVATNGDIEIEEIMEIFHVDRDKATELYVSIQCQDYKIYIHIFKIKKL